MSRVRGRWPFAPLKFELEARFTEISHFDDQDHSVVTPAGDAGRSCELLGISRKTFVRWNAGQLLTTDWADHCAIRLGLHPIDIWSDWHDDVVVDDAAMAAA